MSGRRYHSRVTFLNSLGVLRLSRDVVVVRRAHNELVAVSSEPGVPGEELTIVFSAKDRRETEIVRVTASCPVLVNGSVKHELRLERVDSHVADHDPHRGQVESGSK
jgi:hypothetical protein